MPLVLFFVLGSLLIAASVSPSTVSAQACTANCDIVVEEIRHQRKAGANWFNKLVQNANSKEFKVALAAVSAYFGIPAANAAKVVGVANFAHSVTKGGGGQEEVNGVYQAPVGYDICSVEFLGGERTDRTSFDTSIGRGPQYWGLHYASWVKKQTTVGNDIDLTFRINFIRAEPAVKARYNFDQRCTATGVHPFTCPDHQTQCTFAD